MSFSNDRVMVALDRIGWLRADLLPKAKEREITTFVNLNIDNARMAHLLGMLRSRYYERLRDDDKELIHEFVQRRDFREWIFSRPLELEVLCALVVAPAISGASTEEGLIRALLLSLNRMFNKRHELLEIEPRRFPTRR